MNNETLRASLAELVGTFVLVFVGGFAVASGQGVVVAALAAHGIFDLVHGAAIPNPGVPTWWPEFCLAYDVTAAVYLAWLLGSGRVRAAG